ncbi:hypothetical protein [Acinetobacter bereziniae]|uniref:hypothetical protein n=1 Tax=Acinetobacter bereziniae TaxID=106648 RepID=UPI0032B4F4C8
MKISDESLNGIYEIVNSRITSTSVPNIPKVRTFIDICHRDLVMRPNMSLKNDSAIFYLVNETSNTCEINFGLAPRFEDQRVFIEWAKKELNQVIDNLN